MRRILALLALIVATVVVFVVWPNFRPVPQIRDRALPVLPDGDAPLIIVAFGTSLTARGRWPDLLGERLARCLDRPVEMHTIAKPGAGSDWAIQAVPDVVARKPDLVLLEFSMNDADLLDGVSLAASRQRHTTLLKELDKSLPNLRVLLMTMNPVTGLQRLKRPRLNAYYDIYHTLSETRNTGLADMAPRWAALPAGWSVDGVHPETGLAEQILPGVLAEMIAAAAGGDCPQHKI